LEEIPKKVAVLHGGGEDRLGSHAAIGIPDQRHRPGPIVSSLPRMSFVSRLPVFGLRA
jgi:hypothetical protein